MANLQVTIFVPWRPSPDRLKPWGRVKPVLDATGWPVVLLDDDSNPFSTARSLNMADMFSWDVAMFCEADIVPPTDTLDTAARMAVEAGYVFPWTELQKQPLRGHTAQYRRPYPKPDQLGRRCCPPAGPRMVARWLWDAIGGYDGFYCGWGNEDEDFNIRAAIHLVSLGLPPYAELEGTAQEFQHRKRQGLYGRQRERNARHFAEKLDAWVRDGVL